MPIAPLRPRAAVRVLTGFLLGLLSAVAAASQPATTDRDVLMALYDTTDGPNWARNDNWESDRPLDEWDSVGTDPSGQVTRLELWATGLHGPLPAELGNLTRLRGLYVSRNRLTGPSPAELGKLASLSELGLHTNALEGPIPAELGDLASLQALTLNDNELTGRIPVELARLTTLEYLAAHENRLTGPIPAELAALTRLRRLSLYENALTGSTPAELGVLPRLGGAASRGQQIDWVDSGRAGKAREPSRVSPE